MRKSVGIIGVLLFATFVAAKAGSAPRWPSAGDPAVRRAIVAAIEKDRTVYGGRTPVPGVVLGVWDGRGGSFVRTFGFADLTTRRPLSTADHFRIGSNTKTFVVATILQLADEHRLSLDDPISRFNLGVAVPNAANITVRLLCNMRSGLFEAYDSPQIEKVNFTGSMTFDPRTMIKWAVRQKPYFAPGKGYHYSNTNYLILGLIIEELTHDTVGNEITKRFLKPYNLAHTSYAYTMAMPAPWAHGYGLDRRRNWQDVSNTIPVSLMGAAGAMISDMADMKKWIRLYVTGKTTSAAMHRALMDCVFTGSPGQGFGLALGCSSGWYGYTGGLPGYNTANFYFPETGATIVAWVDVQQNKPVPGVANAMFRDVARVLTPNNIPFPEGVKGL
ncbi:MAG: beta-lactamase family protein [Candidatus Eremiobacteraeota bacterium]|nr:beta-lactamase family protein [Candidatus Eremiobacteraeota bacterium]